VPPYIVFPNKVLEAIAAQQPTTLEELEGIPGIGPAKLEQYGSAVLAIVTDGSQDQIDAEKSTPLAIAETAEPAPVTSQAITPMEIIISVVTDLDGLLTIEGLSRLLTAAPDEIVSFSDHPRFAVFHGTLTAEEMQSHIQQVIGSGEVVLNRHQRLVLPE
jgi:ribonuclease D